MKKKIRYLILMSTLVMLGILTLLSVWGAFAGAQRAGEFFNSPAMATFWMFFLAVLVGGFVLIRGLRARPGMLIIHAALILILAGGIWGSRTAHAIRRKPFKGYLYLYEGTSADALMDENGNPIHDLPFSVCLEKFVMQFYGQKEIQIIDKKNPEKEYRLPAEDDRKLNLDNAEVRVKAFRNLQLGMEDGSMRGHEGPPERSNPGYELTFEFPDGRREVQYVYEQFAMHDIPRYSYRANVLNPQMVKDYISTLTVETKEGVEIRKDIEVNHPLHYGGYHFYQQAWGENERGTYSVIHVVSDSGLAAVFSGFGLLSAGICGQFWLVPAAGYFRRRKEVRNGD